MATLISETSKKKNNSESLFNDFHWYYSTFMKNIQKSSDDFFRKDFDLRLISISYENNILFYGDEYFVNKIKVNKNSSITLKLSSSLVSSILDNTLGVSNEKFSLKTITVIERNLINDFSSYVYKNLEQYINKTEVNRKVIQNSKEYNFTFYIKYGQKHAGKLIISIPEYMLPKIEEEKRKDIFDIDDFESTYVNVRLGTGSTRVPLTEVKALEEGDLIVLENSDINKMSVLWDGKEVKFAITPNPSLIISIDSNGGDEMEDEINANSQNMWDSILVDIVAEFDNVKLSLGELTQISEGLVIDVGSVYDNKIKLRVENQIVATGELVILNDRYAVRIDKVKKSKEEAVKQPANKAATAPAKKAEQPKAPEKKLANVKNPANANNKPQKEEENFDYSDFEIEDESI